MSVEVKVVTPPRGGDTLMFPRQLGVLQPTRLSASRSLINRMVDERWRIDLAQFDIDDRARGEARYRVRAGAHTFDFHVFSYEPVREGRTPRITAGNWDMMGALLEGPSTPSQVEETREQLPKLYRGRAPAGSLVWARSNRSLRLFDDTVTSLAAGRQPSIARLAETGYIMRNTGLDANGTFNTRSFLVYEPDHPLRAPYHPQMLAAYLMREFSVDLAEHLARAVSGRAVQLDPQLKRYLGLGNGSGLGLVLWLNNHPRVVDRWLTVRDEAIGAALDLPAGVVATVLPRFTDLLQRMITYREQDRIRYEHFVASSTVADELRTVQAMIPRVADALHSPSADSTPLRQLCSDAASRISAESLDTLYSICLELVPGICDTRLTDLATSDLLVRRPEQSVGELRDLVRRQYSWVSTLEPETGGPDAFVWYKSRTAEEPRRGPRREVPDAVDLAMPIGRWIRELDEVLATSPASMSTARLLSTHPSLRAIVERVQGLADLQRHTVRATMSGPQLHPTDLIRTVNSAFYGLDKTKDHLDRSLRGLIFHGAPTRTQLDEPWAADWFAPAEPDQAP